jgi:hypothetical protein
MPTKVASPQAELQHARERLANIDRGIVEPLSGETHYLRDRIERLAGEAKAAGRHAEHLANIERVRECRAITNRLGQLQLALVAEKDPRVREQLKAERAGLRQRGNEVLRSLPERYKQLV